MMWKHREVSALPDHSFREALAFKAKGHAMIPQMGPVTHGGVNYGVFLGFWLEDEQERDDRRMWWAQRGMQYAIEASLIAEPARWA